MSVGIALIVRDEATALPACLESVQAGVDEIVVVDTGSQDGTIEVARRFTDRIFHFAWIDDFSAARQFAFEQVASDWVCWIDADERLRGAEHLREAIARAAPETGGFLWQTISAWDAQGRPAFSFWRDRCVRNNGTFRWAGRVHEVLVPRDGLPQPAMIRIPEIVVEHHPQERGISRDPYRNIRILTAAVAEEPRPRELFYLAREHADLGETEEAIATFERYLAVATWDDERYLAQMQVARLHRMARRYEAALDADLQALKTHPHWPDAYFGLAETCYYRQEWAKVAHWVEIGRTMPEPETPVFRDTYRTTYAWMIHYTNALFHLGRTQEALAWTRTALEHDPDDPWHQENLRLFAGMISAEN